MGTTTNPKIWDDIRAGDVLDLTFTQTQDIAFLCSNILKVVLMGYRVNVCASEQSMLDAFWDVLLKCRQRSALYSVHSIEYERCIKCTQNHGQACKSSGYAQADDDALLVYLGAGNSDPEQYRHQVAAEEHALAVVRVW